MSYIETKIAGEEKFNQKTRQVIDAALRDIKQGKNLLRYKSQKELDKYLLSITEKKDVLRWSRNARKLHRSGKLSKLA